MSAGSSFGVLLPPLWGVIAEYAEDLEVPLWAPVPELAAGFGPARIAKHSKDWLVNLVKERKMDLLEIALESGLIPEQITHGQHMNIGIIEDHCDTAATQGCLRALQWLRKNHFPWHTSTVLGYAIQGGRVEVAKWIKENGGEWEPQDYMFFAGQSGSAEMIQWLVDNGCPKTSKTCLGAILKGHLELVKTLYAQGYGNRGDIWYTSSASASGNFELTRWLHEEKKHPLQAEVLANFASHGNLPAMKWASAAGAQWLMEGMPEGLVCSYAASFGHLEILKWAHANGASWNGDVSRAAASYGELQALQWLVENGCPWDPEICLNIVNSALERAIPKRPDQLAETARWIRTQLANEPPDK